MDIRYEWAQMAEAVTACQGCLTRANIWSCASILDWKLRRPERWEEIGETMGFTRERVRQLHNRALEKMCRTCGDFLAEFFRS